MNASVLSRPARDGFTLLELLVVIGLLSAVTALGMSVFVSVDRGWDIRKAEEELEAMIGVVFESLERDMNDVLSAEVSGYSLRGVDDEKRIPDSVPHAYWPQDELIVPVQGTQSGGALLYGRGVRYHVDVQGPADEYAPRAHYSVVRSEDAIDVQTPARAAVTLTPDTASVTGFQIEYAAPGTDEWTHAWDRGDLPAAVRVSLTLQYASRPDVQIARKRVFPIRVR